MPTTTVTKLASSTCRRFIFFPPLETDRPCPGTFKADLRGCCLFLFFAAGSPPGTELKERGLDASRCVRGLYRGPSQEPLCSKTALKMRRHSAGLWRIFSGAHRWI